MVLLGLPQGGEYGNWINAAAAAAEVEAGLTQMGVGGSKLMLGHDRLSDCLTDQRLADCNGAMPMAAACPLATHSSHLPA